MKTIYLAGLLLFFGAASLQLHSQNTPAQSPAGALIQIKSANEALLIRQTATLEALQKMETESNQLRIFAKRG